MKIKALYPGSFDPVSNGHTDIIRRASKLFDEVVVLVADNKNKHYTFTCEEKVMMLKTVTKEFKNVTIDSYQGLVADYAKEKNCQILIRGLRLASDYENEITLFQFNRSLNPNLETIILFPSASNFFLSSSKIKELGQFGGSISKYVHPEIEEFIINKLQGKTK